MVRIRNSSRQYSISDSENSWILGANKSVKSNTTGIYEDAQYGGNTIQIMGDLMASGRGPMKIGVDIHGSETVVKIGAKSRIEADIGVQTALLDQTVVNYGVIDAAHLGIGSFGLTSNFGKIMGDDTGVALFGGAQLQNHAGGKILSSHIGVSVENDSGLETIVTNWGTITGKVLAYQGSAANDILVNYGKMVGDVRLGAGADVYSDGASPYNYGHGGIVTGSIYGGSGDDIYFISAGGNNSHNQSVNIIEKAGEGIDTVHSYGSYTLGDGLENLFLKDFALMGKGNALANFIAGNLMENVLYGGDGDDFIDGKGGSDILTGGEGADIFVYRGNSDVDTITDFQDGVDHIDIGGLGWIGHSITYRDLREEAVSVEGNDLVFTSPIGKLIVKNMSLAQMDESDFIF